MQQNSSAFLKARCCWIGGINFEGNSAACTTYIDDLRTIGTIHLAGADDKDKNVLDEHWNADDQLARIPSELNL